MANELKQEFCNFIKQYVLFFDEMAEQQKKQLAAVMSAELAQVEQSASSLQASLKKLDNLEQKRMTLQKAAGYDKMTFKEIIASLPDEEKEEYSRLFEALETKISEVNFYNSKSQEKVRTDLIRMGSVDTSSGYNAQKKQIDVGTQSGIFEAKA